MHHMSTAWRWGQEDDIHCHYHDCLVLLLTCLVMELTVLVLILTVLSHWIDGGGVKFLTVWKCWQRLTTSRWYVNLRNYFRMVYKTAANHIQMICETIRWYVNLRNYFRVAYKTATPQLKPCNFFWPSIYLSFISLTHPT